jgi:hypothetical protein
LGLLLLLSGCSVLRNLTPVDLKPTDLVGVWRGDGRLQNSAGGTPSIEFTANGYFYADDLGYVHATSEPNWDAVPGSGQWQLEDSSGRRDGALSSVALFQDIIDGKPDTNAFDGLDAQRGSDGIELIAYIGDPDDGNVVLYRRCDDCTGLAPARPSLGVAAAPDPAQLVGVWQDQHGGMLTLDAGGGYVTTDLRPLDLPLDEVYDRPVPSTGTWSVKPPSYDPHGTATTVVIVIDTVDGDRSFGNRSLRIIDTGTELILATESSDPAVREQFIYRRTPPQAR